MNREFIKNFISVKDADKNCMVWINVTQITQIRPIDVDVHEIHFDKGHFVVVNESIDSITDSILDALLG